MRVLPSGKCLLDTNVLIYATSRDDPRHARTVEIFEQARSGAMEAYVSTQNLAEMYPNLTGPKRRPPDSPRLASQKIDSIGRLQNLRVLGIGWAVIEKALELCTKYDVRRQDYFDMQLVAAMMLNGIPTLISENVKDFAAVKEIEAVNPFE